MLVAGVDEVGRGSLAGPIISVAALFDIPDGYWTSVSPIPGAKDSKKFTSDLAREKVFDKIINDPLLIGFGIGQIDVGYINQHGIELANLASFNRAIMTIGTKPETILVDGNKPVPSTSICQYCAPKADNLWWPVSVASILAKVIRDRHMAELSSDWPMYDWINNKGYGSKTHQIALKQYGPSPYHRRLFVRNLI